MTGEMEAKAENCRLAMKAALEAIQDYCGMAPTGEGGVRMVEVRGVKIEVPDEIYEIAMKEPEDPSMGDPRQSDIERSRWARNKAAELCTDWWKLLTRKGYAEPMEKDVMDECVMRVAAEIGARILEERGKW